MHSFEQRTKRENPGRELLGICSRLPWRQMHSRLQPQIAYRNRYLCHGGKTQAPDAAERDYPRHVTTVTVRGRKQGEGHVSRRSLEVQDRFWRADVSGICWAACGAKENGLLWVVGVITYARATNPKKRAGRSGFWGAVALLTVLWIGTLSEAPPSSRLHSQLTHARPAPIVPGWLDFPAL